MSRIDLTRHSLSWTLFLFTGLVVLFWFRSEPAPAVWETPSGTQMPLGMWLDRGAAWLPARVCNLIVALIVFWNGLALSRIISRNMILLERTYLPFILYLLVACGYRFGGFSLAPFAAAGLAVTSYERMIDSFRHETNYARSFDAAFLLSLCVFLYAPAVVLTPLLPCALIIFNKGWREWIASFTGLLLPFGIASYVCWGLGHPLSYVWDLVRSILLERVDLPTFTAEAGTPLMWIFGGVSMTLALLGLFVVLVRRGTMRTRPRKVTLYFVWILFFSMVLIVAPGSTPDDLAVAGLPLSLMMTVALNRFAGVFSNMVYLLLLGAILLDNLTPLFTG